MQNKAKVLAVALVTLCSFPLAAQPVYAGSAARSANPQTAAPAGSDTASVAQMRQVDGELLSKLDTKSAKNGDSVVVKTEESVKTADGTVIPKGSKLVGHVTGVQPHNKTAVNSSLAIQFDHAQLKSGKSVAIESVVKSIAPPEGAGSMNDPAALPGSSCMASMGGGSPTGGSAMGSSSGGAMVRPSPGAGAGPMMGGGPAPGTVVARKGNVAIRTTSIPGVLLASNENGQPLPNASGLFFGAHQNIHLDGGTRFVLGVAASQPATN